VKTSAAFLQMIGNMGRTPSDKLGTTETGDPSNASAPRVPLEGDRGGRLRNRVRDAHSTVDETKRSLLERAERERDRHESVRAIFRHVDEDRGRGGGLLAGVLLTECSSGSCRHRLRQRRC
jgi:hypothetical protein